MTLFNFPEKVYEVNPKILRDVFYHYFVLATDREDAEEMALFLFKEQFKLYTGHYEISLYHREVDFETYVAPNILEASDANKYKCVYERSIRKAKNDKNVVCL